MSLVLTRRTGMSPTILSLIAYATYKSCSSEIYFNFQYAEQADH